MAHTGTSEVRPQRPQQMHKSHLKQENRAICPQSEGPAACLQSLPLDRTAAALPPSRILQTPLGIRIDGQTWHLQSRGEAEFDFNKSALRRQASVSAWMRARVLNLSKTLKIHHLMKNGNMGACAQERCPCVIGRRRNRTHGNKTCTLPILKREKHERECTTARKVAKR